jgi:hypothetical protein
MVSAGYPDAPESQAKMAPRGTFGCPALLMVALSVRPVHGGLLEQARRPMKVQLQSQYSRSYVPFAESHV